MQREDNWDVNSDTPALSADSEYVRLGRVVQRSHNARGERIDGAPLRRKLVSSSVATRRTYDAWL